MLAARKGKTIETAGQSKKGVTDPFDHALRGAEGI